MVSYQSAKHLRRERERELFGVITRVEKKQESGVLETLMSMPKLYHHQINVSFNRAKK